MPITETELAEARAAWGNGLVAISTAYDDFGIKAARAVADDLLDELYNGSGSEAVWFDVASRAGVSVMDSCNFWSEPGVAPMFKVKVSVIGEVQLAVVPFLVGSHKFSPKVWNTWRCYSLAKDLAEAFDQASVSKSAEENCNKVLRHVARELKLRDDG